MVYTVNGVNYTRRKKIPVTGAGSGAQTDFQIKLAATWSASMQADFDDVRFTKADMQTLIDAWLESKVNSTSANIWAEFPTTPADGVVKTEAYMYYGNAGAASDWDIGATFLFGDDFPGSSLDTNKWTHNRSQGVLSIADSIATLTTSSSGAYNEEIHSISNHSYSALRYKAKYTLGSQGAAGYINSAQEYGSPEKYSTSIVQYYSNDGKAVNGNDASVEYYTPLGNTRDAFKTFEIVRQSGYSKYYEDGALLATLTSYPTSVNREVFLAARSSPGKIECDWVAVRKDVVNPPTYEFGAEEHQRRIPMMM